MNVRRPVLIWTVCGCLALGGASLRAGEASVAELIGGLKSSDESARLQAIDRLGALGDKAAEAVAPLTELLQRRLGEGPRPRGPIAGRRSAPRRSRPYPP